MEVLLSLEQAAKLENTKYHTLYRKIERNKLNAVKVPARQRHGFEYRVPLKELSEQAQALYYKRLADEAGAKAMEVSGEKDGELERRYEGLTLNDLTEDQREQVAFWKRVISKWQSYIAGSRGKKTKMTEQFVRQFNESSERAITERTLYYKYDLYKKHGEVALADLRMSRRGRGETTIPFETRVLFEQFWLDEAQPTVMHCFRLLCALAELERPELLPLPAVDSFYRAVKKIPVPVVRYWREGDKSLEDKVFPYTKRSYDYIFSNDVWCSDYHTLDFFVRCDFTGRVFRPYVIFWVDVRSRKVLSIFLAESANADGVFISFRKAVRNFGFPRDIYIDNGREYLVHDFGGRGRRKSDEKASYGQTLLETLGVGMTTAIPGNARAKLAERVFRVVSEEFSKLIKTYCGSRPEKKPQRLEKTLKKQEEIPLFSEIARDLELYVEGWLNQLPSKAEGLNGLSRNECYAENLLRKRTATKEELDQLLLRSVRGQKVKRNGVVLKFGDTELQYYNTELINHYFGQTVYLRYDPEDLLKVRVEDKEGRFLMEAELLLQGGYGGEKDKEAIRKVSRLVKEHKEFIKGYKEKLEGERLAPEAKEILLRKAAKNIEEEQLTYEAQVLEPLAFEKIKELAKVAGGDDDIVSFERMVRNAQKHEKYKEEE